EVEEAATDLRRDGGALATLDAVVPEVRKAHHAAGHGESDVDVPLVVLSFGGLVLVGLRRVGRATRRIVASVHAETGFVQLRNGRNGVGDAQVDEFGDVGLLE